MRVVVCGKKRVELEGEGGRRGRGGSGGERGGRRIWGNRGENDGRRGEDREMMGEMRGSCRKAVEG